MAKAMVAACVFLMLAPVAVADPVFLPFKAEPGQSWKIDQTRTTTTIRGGRAPSTLTADMVATVKVVSVTDAGYVMEWETDSFSADGRVITFDPDLYIGVPIRFETDAGGVPVRVQDSTALLDRVFAGRIYENNSPTNRAAALATREQFLAMPPPKLAEMLLAEATVIASCQNRELEPGAPVTQRIVTGSSDWPIDTVETVTMEDAGSAEAPARIRIVRIPEEESKADAVTGFFQSDEARAPVSLAVSLALLRTTETECLVDTTTGHTLAATVVMTDGGGASQKRDVREMTVTRVQ